MLTLDQAKATAATLSEQKGRPYFINRFFYHNPTTKEKELRYVVEPTTKVTKTVFTYIDGKQMS